MRKKRIDGALASIPVQNGQVLKGEHLAILREVLSAAINENKYDIDRVITADPDAIHVYGNDVEALNAYASENPVDDGTLGYLYTENQILFYKYLANNNEWDDLGVLNLTELFNKIQELNMAVESGYYDEINNELVLVLANSSEIRIPVGELFTDLDAHNIIFNGSGTNYLTAKTEVEGAIKELDTRVKNNADNVALKVNSVNGKQDVVVLNQDDVGEGDLYKRVSQTEKNTWNNKQNKLVAGAYISIIGNTISASGGGGGGEVDLNMMAYFNYASSIYGAKYGLLVSAWERSLIVDPLEISESITPSSGTAQYPNGETEGVIIPQGVTNIINQAFYNWTSNNQPLVIPNSVTLIGAGAFSQWTSNNQPLVIPQGVTSIGAQAFFNWTSNNHPLVIPDSVTTIGQGVFANWLLVPYVEMQSTTPPTLANASAFDGQNDAPIYVPDASVAAYKAATNWVDLADRIFSINDK